MKYRLLRLCLFAAALGWGVAIVGVFLPWPVAVSWLRGLGAGEMPRDPMMDYWLRMAAGAFAGIGIFVFTIALRPKRYRNVIGLIGGLSVLEGLVLLGHGLRLGLSPFPFYGDAAFCLLIGAGIWVLRKERSEEIPGGEPEED